MYYYVYDEFVSDRKYERELIAMENRLADLGIAGRVARLALFKDAVALIEDELRRNAITTIIAVGNDLTVQKLADAVTGHDVALGIIPIGSGNTLAKMLGIPHGTEAVDVLSARNIETIDVGSLNGQCFITGVCFPKDAGRMTCDGCYTVSTKALGTIQVRNLACGDPDEEGVADPTDGKLEAVVSTVARRSMLRSSPTESVFISREFEVDFPEAVIATADGKEVKSTHFSITIEPMSLKVITGKDRMF